MKDRPRAGHHTPSDEGGLGPVPHRQRAWYEQHASLSGRAVADETGLEHLLDAALEKPLCGYAGPLTQINAAAPRHRDPCEGCVIEMERRLHGHG